MAVDKPHPQVIIVGAGPVGLLLAGELSLHGVRVLVAERLAEPMNESRASQLTARTVEIIDQRGLLERFGELQHETTGHFGGLPLYVSGTRSEHAGHWKIPQYRTEAALDDWARELGVDLRRGYELTAMTVAGEGVRAEFQTSQGPVSIHAPYLAGCDGARSTVRRLTGFNVAGTEATRELLRADVTGVEIPDRRFERLERGLAVAARSDNGVTRVMVHESGRTVADRTGPPEFAEVARAWAKVTGEDISVGTPIWVDTFSNACKQATEYRRGRILLCGDAAHEQMPVGGQALNLGLQDAFNLGWKLAAAVHGWAPDGLLDSYHGERHPVGERVLGNVTAQELLLFGSPEVDAMRTVLGEILELPEASARLAEMVSGLDVRYDYGTDEHALAGARMPPMELSTDEGPSSTTALLRCGGGVLLDLGGEPDAGTERLAKARSWTGKVRTVSARPRADDPTHGTGAMLLRPDGHVAWTDSAAEDVRTALRRWFGEST